MNHSQIPKRRYRDDVDLSILGFGGMVLVDLQREAANNIVGEAFERGINYFYVLPFLSSMKIEDQFFIRVCALGGTENCFIFSNFEQW